MKRRLFCGFLASLVFMSACGPDSGRGEGGLEEANANPLPVQEISLEGEVEGEITIYLYEAMTNESYLEEAARAFESKYPGTKVNLEVFSAMPEAKTTTLEDGTMIYMISAEYDPDAVNDYISRVNTELMGGGGADILAMDVLPYYNYADSGLLENLNAYIEADTDFSRADYWDNVLKGSEYKGGLYMMPLGFYYSVICYNQNIVSEETQRKLDSMDTFTYDEIYEMIKDEFVPVSPDNGNENKFIDFRGAYNAYTELFQYNTGRYVDMENRKANFTDGKFAALLEHTKALEESGMIREDNAVDFDTVDINEYFNREMPEYNYYLSQTGDSSLGDLYKFDMDINMYLGYSSELNGDYKVAGLMADDDGNVPFYQSLSYGLNSNSENKRTAWEFIKFLTSYEMQMSSNMRGRPIHKAATMDRTEHDITGYMYYEDLNDAPKLESENDLALLKLYQNDIMTLTAKINKIRFIDSTVSEMIDGELEEFYYSDDPPEAGAVAQNVQNRVELYLSE